MDFLDDLMGGEEQNERTKGKKKDGRKKGGGKRREEYRDFAERYDRGAPYEGISDEEAMNRYREIAPNLSDGEYRESAREAFSRMRPEERVQFGQQLRGYAHEQGQGDFVDRDHDGQDDRFQNPDYLAGMMSNMNSRQPDMLGQLMSGMMGGGMGSSGGMGGAAGMLGSLMGSSGTQSGGGGIMGNPVARAAVGGIAAMAVKRMTGSR